MGHRTVRCRTGQALFTVRAALTLRETVHALFTFCRRPLAQ
jgi:hypothetical protein